MPDSVLVSDAVAGLINSHFLKSVTDTRGVILEANDLFCRLSEYPREELIGKPHSIIKSGYHSAAFFRQFWQTIQEHQVWHGEICNRAKSGRLYWVDTFVMPCRLANGEKGYLSIRYDITPLKALQSAVDNHSSAIDRKNQRLNQIAFALAHEVRAPLANMLAIVDGIEQGMISGDQLPRMLAALKKQAHEADRLFEKIMQSAVPDEGASL
ncbi:MAG: PAS domain S-box protein [Turneriella sp.]|nr:PAS domain S-box protein [Turneriella sp.]